MLSCDVDSDECAQVPVNAIVDTSRKTRRQVDNETPSAMLVCFRDDSQRANLNVERLQLAGSGLQGDCLTFISHVIVHGFDISRSRRHVSTQWPARCLTVILIETDPETISQTIQVTTSNKLTIADLTSKLLYVKYRSSAEHRYTCGAIRRPGDESFSRL